MQPLKLTRFRDTSIHPPGLVLRSLALLAAAMPLAEPAMGIEMPEYTVVFRDGDIEYRQYATYLVAETTVRDRADYSDAGDEGFRRLFRYITGANTGQAKIAMTAPVEQGAVAGNNSMLTTAGQPATSQEIAMTAPVEQVPASGGWTVSFVVPREYSTDNVPVPVDPQVRIREVSGELRAVLRYSGRWTQKRFEERKAELLLSLASAGIKPQGEVHSALYNPPYMPPFLRRNEVHVAVSGLPPAAVARN